MSFRGAVFDLDGVLVDTEGYQWSGWNEVLRKHGISISKEKYLDYAGKTGAIIEQEIVRDFGIEIQKGSLIREKEELLMEWFSTIELNIMPHALEAIGYFINKQMKIAVCSGGPMSEILLKLERTGLMKYFDKRLIASRDDVEHGKPHPDIYLHAAALLGLQPKECVAFEDTQYGVQSAKGAGFYCIAIPTPYSARHDFSLADVVVAGFMEAIKKLEDEMKAC